MAVAEAAVAAYTCARLGRGVPSGPILHPDQHNPPLVYNLLDHPRQQQAHPSPPSRRYSYYQQSCKRAAILIMPALKSSAAVRSRSRDSPQRAWGTRYDTLLNTAEPSQGISSPTSSAVSSPLSPANELSRDLGSLSGHAETGSDPTAASAQPERKRDWADDEVPQMLGTPDASYFDQSSQSRSEYNSTLACATATDSPRRDAGKQPHSASVFVGR